MRDKSLFLLALMLPIAIMPQAMAQAATTPLAMPGNPPITPMVNLAEAPPTTPTTESEPHKSIFSEVRFGAMAHDVQFGSGGPHEGGADINGELLFTSLFNDNDVDFAPKYLRWLLKPRPMVGFQVNTSGYTSQGYGGITLSVALFENVFRSGDAILFDAGESASINSGHVDDRTGPFKRIGSNVLFRSNLDIGYRFDAHWAAYIELDHESNAGFAKDNQGLSQIGMRLGFLF